MAIGFPTYGRLCPFWFFSWASLTYLLPLGLFIPFTNSAFSWAITNFIGLPWPNYFILILGIHGLAINPLLSLFALLLGLQWPILTFLHHILPMGMLFLSFRASLSSFTSSRPIYYFMNLWSIIPAAWAWWFCHLFAKPLLPLLLGFLPSTWILNKIKWKN